MQNYLSFDLWVKLSARNSIFHFTCIYRSSNSLKRDNINDLSVLYKQSDSVFCLADKIARRTACGPQGTYWKTPAVSEVVSSLPSAAFFTKRERGDGEPQAVYRTELPPKWYSRFLATQKYKHHKKYNREKTSLARNRLHLYIVKKHIKYPANL